MALVGYELVIVGVVLLVLLMWGPKKIPEIAKAVGEAKREFDKAGKAISGEEEEKKQP